MGIECLHDHTRILYLDMNQQFYQFVRQIRSQRCRCMPEGSASQVDLPVLDFNSKFPRAPRSCILSALHTTRSIHDFCIVVVVPLITRCYRRSSLSSPCLFHSSFHVYHLASINVSRSSPSDRWNANAAVKNNMSSRRCDKVCPYCIST